MVDTPESFAFDLVKSGAEAVAATRLITQASAKRVKDQAKANVKRTAPRRNAGAPEAITYSTKVDPTEVSAEIGYDKSIRGGRLGNLLEFGGGGDHSPPHSDLRLALEAEEPAYAAAIAALAEKLL